MTETPRATGGYIPRPDGTDALLVDLSHCKVLTTWDRCHPLDALNAALADKDTEWVIPAALIKACAPELTIEIEARRG